MADMTASSDLTNRLTNLRNAIDLVMAHPAGTAALANLNTLSPIFTLPTAILPTLLPTIFPTIVPTFPTLSPTLAPVPQPTPTSPRVQPGDLITADLINSILQRLDGLAAQVSDVRFVLGPLAANTHTLVALGTGFEQSGGIWLDGVSLLTTAPVRGVNLVVLDPNLSLKFRATYDTWGSANASAQLANDLFQQTGQYDVVAAVSHDAFALNLTPQAKAALAAVGGASLAQAPADTRANAAFIGVVPASKTVAFDYLTSVIPADGAGWGNPRLASLPFAWGLYSVALQRFLLGGASGSAGVLAAAPTVPTLPTLTIPTIITQPTFTLPTITVPTFIGPIVTQPINVGPVVSQPVNIGPLVRLIQPTDAVTALPGVGRAESELLAGAGIHNVSGLAASDPQAVASTLNIAHDVAANLIGSARTMLGG
jgi:hypothetical protein